MIDKSFGEVFFDTGWCKNEFISFRNKQYEITVCARSYRETDLITDEQRFAFELFMENKSALEKEIENMLITYENEEFLGFLKPTDLVFERDGKYALLFDDETDLDNGIAVELAPDKEVMTQDDYL